MANCASSSSAYSRMGTAQISDVNGLPCFSIPLDYETEDGVSFYSLYVSELTSPDHGRTLPPMLWSISARDATSPPQLLPPACIPYGQTPPDTVQRTLQPLSLFRPYYVAVRAWRKKTSLVAYTAEFCITADIEGKLKARVIPQDQRLGPQRYDVCKKPPPRVINPVNSET